MSLIISVLKQSVIKLNDKLWNLLTQKTNSNYSQATVDGKKGLSVKCNKVSGTYICILVSLFVRQCKCKVVTAKARVCQKHRDCKWLLAVGTHTYASGSTCSDF